MKSKEGMPVHVAVIMDGNGRWAKQHGKTRLSGHNAGMKAMTETVRRCSDLGVQHLTVYAFSTENWKRSAAEVTGISKLLVKYVEKDLNELHENNVKVDVFGDYTTLPPGAVDALERTIERTKENTGLKFHIALNYGSRAEMLRAVNELIREATETAPPRHCEERSDEAIQCTEEMFASKLYSAGVPDPDLVIRTSGEQRLSNFLLWQSAYSELVFTDTLWPDFTPDQLEECIEIYKGRKRRFGGR
jgi:undecaprenyl diphosphate synthase